jgi:hypothetical protein
MLLCEWSKLLITFQHDRTMHERIVERDASRSFACVRINTLHAHGQINTNDAIRYDARVRDTLVRVQCPCAFAINHNG